MGCVSSDEQERIKFKQYKNPATKKINRTQAQKPTPHPRFEEDGLKQEDNE